MDLNQLKKKSLAELTAQARALSVREIDSLKKPELIAAIIRAQASNGDIYATGTLEILPDGFGFLRAAADSFLPGPEDVYVSPSQIRKFRLHTGDSVRGMVRPPKESERYFALLRVEAVNEHPAEGERARPGFADHRVEHPSARLQLDGSVTVRALDLLAPLGLGQRALVYAPPRSGLTRLFRDLALAIHKNHPEVKCIVVLVDERPEEVTSLRDELPVDVVASTFDEEAQRHGQVAEMVVENAKRLAESGKDVVLLVDSLTRLARAFSLEPSESPALPGGLRAEALMRCKRLLGAGRKLHGSGSITLVAALRDTEDPLDRFLHQELGGAANCEIHLAQTEPGIRAASSATHREELLRPHEDLEALRAFRRRIGQNGSADEAQELVVALREHPDNAKVLAQLRKRA